MITIFSDMVKTFSDVISSFLENDLFVTCLCTVIPIFLTISVISRIVRMIMGDDLSLFDFTALFRKRKSDLSSDKAENIGKDIVIENEQDCNSPVRHIRVYNVMLDKILFEYEGDYALEEKRGVCTIYYTDNGVHKQFEFDNTKYVAVYEDVLE